MDKLIFRSVKDVATRSAASFLMIGKRTVLADLLPSATGLLSEGLKSQIGAQFPIAFVSGKTDSVTYHHGTSEEDSTQVTFAHLSDDRSRNLGHIRSDLIPGLVKKNITKSPTSVVILVLENKDQIIPASSAVARAFPEYSVKTGSKSDREINVDFLVKDTNFSEQELSVIYKEAQALADSIRLAGRLVDEPCCTLHTNSYLNEVGKLVKENSKTLSLEVINGEGLQRRGFGGLWNVGKAAVNGPALAIIKYTPVKKTVSKTISLVGKGIVYDTGGLSIKSTANMSGMKGDMGGSAACLGAILALSKTGYGGEVFALLCLAENACGSKAQRVDDVYQGYSGKTVEVNNTDAEGRLVLGDGVAYASKDLKTDYIVDIATLTGAQMITTGMLHAAVLTPDEDFENVLRTCGKDSGDWVYPILYAPEILFKEFESPVADMKNSVKSRTNAQSSCAGHFIEEHISKEWNGKWAHIDIAGPAERDARGTGFGVGLLYKLVKSFSA